MHLRHFTTTLGTSFVAQQLNLADLQRHVSERARKKYRGNPLSPVTLKKEMASFRAAWNWAALTGLVSGQFPSKGLVYPKADEKLPFMTRQEIERKLHDKMTDKELAELWDCLYLTRPDWMNSWNSSEAMPPMPGFIRSSALSGTPDAGGRRPSACSSQT